MFLNLHRWVVLAALSSLLLLTGCESWGRPKTPLPATSIQISRRQPAVSASRPSVKQTLKIELYSGLALLSVEGGKDYPTQIPSDQLAKLRSAVGDRKWQIGDRKPPTKTNPDTITFYDAKAFTGKTVVPKGASWTEPAAKPLPPEIKLFETTFDQVSLTVHPLSDDVDLLK